MSVRLVSTDYFIIPDLLKLKIYDKILIFSSEITTKNNEYYITSNENSFYDEYLRILNERVIVKESICLIIDFLTIKFVNHKKFPLLFKRRKENNTDIVFYNLSNLNRLEIDHMEIDYFILGRKENSEDNIHILAYIIGDMKLNAKMLLYKYNKTLEENGFFVINMRKKENNLKGIKLNNLKLSKIM